MVDAYNVLCSISNKKTVEQRQKEQFIQLVKNYAGRKGHTLLIVFDGGLFPWPTQEHKASLVRVIYAGQGHSADDYISTYIQEHKNADILVASNDRQVCNAAARYGKMSIGATDFFDLLMRYHSTKQSKVPSDVIQKLAQNQESSDLDTLMQEAAKMRVTHKQEYIQLPQKKRGRTGTKDEQLLLKKIKKL